MSAPISTVDQKNEVYALMRSYAASEGLSADELIVARAVWMNRVPEKPWKARQKKWVQRLTILHQEKLAKEEFQNTPIDETVARLFLLRLLAHLRVLVRVWRRDQTHASTLSIMEMMQQYDYVWLWVESLSKVSLWKRFSRLWGEITEQIFIPLPYYERQQGAFVVELVKNDPSHRTQDVLVRFFRSNGMLTRIHNDAVRVRAFRIHNRAIRRILTVLQVRWAAHIRVSWREQTEPDTPWQFPYSTKTYNHAMLEFNRLRFLDSVQTFDPYKGLRRVRDLVAVFDGVKNE